MPEKNGITDRQARAAARAVIGSLLMGSEPNLIIGSLAFRALQEWCDWDHDKEAQEIVARRHAQQAMYDEHNRKQGN